jgi:hypothetical protein
MRPMLTTWLGLLSLGTGAALAYAQPEDWISLDRCAGCHQQGEKWNKKPNPKLDPLNKKKTTDFVLMNEYETWSQHDPHRNAAQALTNALGRRMGQLLQIKPEQHTACLSCHAVDTQPTKPFADKTADDYYSAEGNNCLSCHGKSRQWFEPHSLVSWRTKTPQEKSEKGLVDLRDAVVRAELCASCHVGNASEGKIVTHEMYAAGHPPLMPLEVISFCDHEPRHWRWPDEVPYFKADELTKEQLRDIYHYYPGTNDRTRQMVLSALTSFRVTMQMLQAEAQNGPLDLAHFDCYACHHDLKRPSWRQQRGYPGRPAGRPIIRPVSYELVRAVLAGTGGDVATLDAKMAALNRAYTARAFGTPKQIAASAAELIAWTNEPRRQSHARCLCRCAAVVGGCPRADRWVPQRPQATGRTAVRLRHQLATDQRPERGPGRSVPEARRAGHARLASARRPLAAVAAAAQGASLQLRPTTPRPFSVTQRLRPALAVGVFRGVGPLARRGRSAAALTQSLIPCRWSTADLSG